MTTGSSDMATSYTNPLFETCPCCGSRTLEERLLWDICPICRWQDDPVQAKNPEFAGGANEESLNAARKRWRENGEPAFPLRVRMRDGSIVSFETRQELIDRRGNVDTTSPESNETATDVRGREVALTVRRGSVDLLALTEQIWEKQ
jgi:hypothetical protein